MSSCSDQEMLLSGGVALPFILVQDVKCKQNIGGKRVATGLNFLGHSSLTTLKRPCDIQNEHAQKLRKKVYFK
ncbi:hypothetical protein M6B38_157150 [Iris pallida]|uniref:Uncharacterized protein n=1 Tax=Iris pallida TaxID=29817 RepID=A0AAX6F1S9_IRIPA|nr:hypothetical protein M6B38_157150 [Iris pallida]